MAESSSQQRREDRRSSTEESAHFAPDSSCLLFEDRFLCSVCQNVFTDPVSTPCGHNFCMKCIKTCWGDSEQCHCPFCKEKFTKRPELKVNTAFREVVDHFKKKSGLDKPEVLCDACIGEKQEALKSCVDCRLTLCKSHLESHNNMLKLKEHKLISPLKNLEDYICQKHRRPLELFCRDDQMSACMVCTVTDHKKHNTVPVEEGIGEMKSQLEKTQTEVQQMIQDRLKKIKDIKHSVDLSQKNMEKEIAYSVEVLTALMRSIERSQAELLKVMEEKQKAAERQAEDLIKELEQEITELKRRDTELEQLSHTEDHLHLLQIYPSLCRPPHTNNWTGISIDPIIDLSVDIVRNVLSQLQKSLDEMIIESELKRIQQYAVDVTLDADTAHPKLILSDDGKQVTHGDTKQNLPDNPKRFDRCSCVLGKEGFSSGRFYYEVQVREKTEWDVGVVRESINRKGKTITLTPQNGFWIVILRNGNKYFACAGPPVLLSLRKRPQKVGVFVDYEEGLVSVYDVESRSHIYSFTGQSFTEKLYPFFSPCKNDGAKNSAPLIISPVSKT
ncbi:E3 ubiquitin-protein ligase TRIM39-like [Colossoma macropomum]|uniref:E3 ubiquitin-protein ligase TRIM39-like n=1 Tax=Colossoma macropomum TaxID=42526 RepID=UPI001864D717|nr:E3 ubiquitin-protein ligase TRIM39-like [Colossoma macropomum]XP_036416392.1 E3 ubiquitin-protein ligase TRIM39-like [Colossoma macropomum]